MTQENEIKRPIQDLEHKPIKPLDNSEKGSKVSQALETITTTAEKVQRQPVIAHLIRATERFNYDHEAAQVIHRIWVYIR